MSLDLAKPWRRGGMAELPGHMGVFELADAAGEVVFVGFAGGRSRFGLRGEIQAAAGRLEVDCYRFEVTTAYLTRYRELLMAYRARHGRLPAGNPPMPGLGRLSPQPPAAGAEPGAP